MIRLLAIATLLIYTYSNKFKEYFPPKSWGNYDFVLRYEINHDFIQIFRSTSRPDLSAI